MPARAQTVRFAAAGLPPCGGQCGGAGRGTTRAPCAAAGWTAAPAGPAPAGPAPCHNIPGSLGGPRGRCTASPGEKTDSRPPVVRSVPGRRARSTRCGNAALLPGPSRGQVRPRGRGPVLPRSHAVTGPRCRSGGSRAVTPSGPGRFRCASTRGRRSWRACRAAGGRRLGEERPPPCPDAVAIPGGTCQSVSSAGPVRAGSRCIRRFRVRGCVGRP